MRRSWAFDGGRARGRRRKGIDLEGAV